MHKHITNWKLKEARIINYGVMNSTKCHYRFDDKCDIKDCGISLKHKFIFLSAWWTQYFYFQFLFCQSFFMKQTFDGFFSFSFF